MAKYRANEYLLHHGKIVESGEEIELTEEQANRLGTKVVPANYEEGKNLEEYKVDELREFAKRQNVENYGELKKDELIKALERK